MSLAAFRIWSIEHFGTWPNRLHAMAVLLVGVIAVGGIAAGRSSWWHAALIELGLVVALLVRIRRSQKPRTLGGWGEQVEVHPGLDELPSEMSAAFRGERP